GGDVTGPAGMRMRSDSAGDVSGGRQAPDGDSGIGTTIDIQGDLQAPSVQISGGSDLDYIQLDNPNCINAGNATAVFGDDADDRIFVRAVSSAAGTTTGLYGNAGADRFFVSSNATKALFITDGVYDDDTAPLDRLSGDLTHLGGLLINTGTGGNGGTVDGIFLSADGATSSLTGTLDVGTVSGLGMRDPITYSA